MSDDEMSPPELLAGHSSLIDGLMSDELRQLVSSAILPALGPGIAGMVLRLLDDTACRTVRGEPDGEVSVITGDIPAMWLRDSCAQMAPFVRLAAHLDGRARNGVLATIAALLRRQWRMILLDPYANAFRCDLTIPRWDPDDQPAPAEWVWERKFELDSLAYPVTLAARLIALGDESCVTPDMARALERIVEVFHTEIDHETRSTYTFIRRGADERDTLGRYGRGPVTAPVGLVWSGFRPSDDACQLGFNVPGNFFTAKALGEVAELCQRFAGHAAFAVVDAVGLARTARDLQLGLLRALGEHSVVQAPDGRRILAYEVDGLGGHVLMDDANNPSLMSLPYLDALPDQFRQVWNTTREWLLSEQNPWFFAGTALRGIGSPHTGPGRVWPIALATQGLVSDDAEERRHLIDLLVTTTADTGRMHEGVDVDDPGKFSREWFSWADMMFCELVLEHCGL